jgi:hypothetical protein
MNHAKTFRKFVTLWIRMLYKDFQAHLYKSMMLSTRNHMFLAASMLLLAVSLPSVVCDDEALETVLAPLPSVTKSTPPSTQNPNNEDVVSFTERIYSALGTKKTAELAVDFKGEYATLNWDGSLSEKLGALQEMRLQDLQLSVRHARKMRDLLDLLDAGPTAPHPDDGGSDVGSEVPAAPSNVSSEEVAPSAVSSEEVAPAAAAVSADEVAPAAQEQKADKEALPPLPVKAAAATKTKA